MIGKPTGNTACSIATPTTSVGIVHHRHAGQDSIRLQSNQTAKFVGAEYRTPFEAFQAAHSAGYRITHVDLS